MQTIIKHNQVIEDHWSLLDADAELAQALSTVQPIITLANGLGYLAANWG